MISVVEGVLIIKLEDTNLSEKEKYGFLVDRFIAVIDEKTRLESANKRLQQEIENLKSTFSLTNRIN
jgi:hypothetical protein